MKKIWLIGLLAFFLIPTVQATTYANLTITESKGVIESNIIGSGMGEPFFLTGLNGTNISAELRAYAEDGNAIRTQIVWANATAVRVYTYYNRTLAAGASANITFSWDNGLSEPNYPILVYCHDNFTGVTAGTVTGNCGWQVSQGTVTASVDSFGKFVVTSSSGNAIMNATAVGNLSIDNGPLSICGWWTRNSGAGNDMAVGLSRMNTTWAYIIQAGTGGSTTTGYLQDGATTLDTVAVTHNFSGETLCLHMNATTAGNVRGVYMPDTNATRAVLLNNLAIDPDRKYGSPYIYNQQTSNASWDNITVYNISEVNEYNKEVSWLFYAPEEAPPSGTLPQPYWISPTKSNYSDDPTNITVKYQMVNVTDYSTVLSGKINVYNLTGSINYTMTCGGKYCYFNISQTENATINITAYITNSSGENLTKTLTYVFEIQVPSTCTRISDIEHTGSGQNTAITLTTGNWNLTDIWDCIEDNSSLQQTSYKNWFLNANITVKADATLWLNSTDISWLKVNSTGNVIHNITGTGRLMMDSIMVTSWNSAGSTFDTGSYDNSNPRSYINMVDYPGFHVISNSNISYFGYGSTDPPHNPHSLSFQNTTVFANNMTYSNIRAIVNVDVRNSSYTNIRVSDAPAGLYFGPNSINDTAINMTCWGITVDFCLETFNASDILVQGGVFYNSMYGTGLQGYGKPTGNNLTLRDATFYGNSYGITFDWGARDVWVINNTAYGNTYNVYSITNSYWGAIQNVGFWNNSIQNATTNNILINAIGFAITNFTMNYNTILGAGSEEISSTSTATINATYNFWGDAATNLSIYNSFTNSSTIYWYPFFTVAGGFSSDTTPPNIDWVSPANNSFTNNSSQIDWDVTVSETPGQCYLQINSSANVSMTYSGGHCIYNSTSLTNQTTYCGKVYANDTSGNMNLSSVQCATINLSQGTPPSGTLPQPYFVTPSNGTNVTTKYLFVNVSDYSTLTSCKMNWDNGSAVNYTMTASGKYCYINMSQTANATVIYKVYATNSTGENVTADWSTGFSIHIPSTAYNITILVYDEEDTSLQLRNFTAEFISDSGTKTFGVNSSHYGYGVAGGGSITNSSYAFDIQNSTFAYITGDGVGNATSGGWVLAGDIDRLCIRWNYTNVAGETVEAFLYAKDSTGTWNLLGGSGVKTTAFGATDTCFAFSASSYTDTVQVNATFSMVNYVPGTAFIRVFEVFAGSWNQSNGGLTINQSILDSGDNRIDINDIAESYYERSYYQSIDSNTEIIMNAYLPAKTSTVVQSIFIVRNQYGNAVTDATVSVQKQISGSYVSVGSMQTDDTGTASFYLLENNPYRLLVTSGSTILYYSFNALAKEYYITLNESQAVNFTALFDDIFMSVGPAYISYNGSLTSYDQKFTLNITSNKSLLTNFGIMLFCNGTYLLNMTNATDAAGGLIEITEDIAACDNITMSYYFEKDGYGIWWKDQIYQILKGSGYGLWQAIRLFQGGFSTDVQLFIFIIALVIIGSALVAFGPEGSIAGSLIAFSIFVYMDAGAANPMGLTGIFVVIAVASLGMIAVKRRWI